MMRSRRLMGTALTCGVLLAATVTAPVAQASPRDVWGCATGYVCVYSVDGWTKAAPENRYTAYGYNLLQDQYGEHVVFNNQYGGAGAYLCTGASGGCGQAVGINGAVVVDLTPINSIRLTPTGGSNGEQAGKLPDSDINKWSSVKLNGKGDQFVNYDFNWSVGDNTMTKVDWPVNLVFVSKGKISTSKVKEVVGGDFPEMGGAMHAFLKNTSWDSDNGRKQYAGKCGKEGVEPDNNFHFRIYGPDGEGSLTHPDLGNFVIATSHIDHLENCASGTWFGNSEIAETFIAGVFAKRGKKVEWNKIPLANAEDEGNRFNNGYATVVHLD